MGPPRVGEVSRVTSSEGSLKQVLGADGWSWENVSVGGFQQREGMGWVQPSLQTGAGVKKPLACSDSWYALCMRLSFLGATERRRGWSTPGCWRRGVRVCGRVKYAESRFFAKETVSVPWGLLKPLE